MYTLIFIFIFLLGTVIGSFLNVVIYRFNTGLPIVKGRSKCMTCNHKLCWYELMPLLSYAFQNGKCHKCKSPISKQYFIVELVTGLMFVLISLHFLEALFISSSLYIFLVAVFAFIFSLLIIISVYDIRHKIIPDKLVYIFIGVSLILVFVNWTTGNPLFIIPSFINLFAGPILAAPFALLFLVSKGKWMGLGDAKLILGIGWMLGFSLGIASVILSFWIGSIISLFVMFFTKNKIGMKTEIPFAPFLIIGAFIVFLFSIDLYSLCKLFQF